MIAGERVRPSECSAIVAAINFWTSKHSCGAGADRLAFEFADIPVPPVVAKARFWVSDQMRPTGAGGPSIRRRQPTGYMGGR